MKSMHFLAIWFLSLAVCLPLVGCGGGKTLGDVGDPCPCKAGLVCTNGICLEPSGECEPPCNSLTETCFEGDCVTIRDSDDRDADGSLAGDDCDDYNAEVHPGAQEYCDGIDNDCDGNTDAGCPACTDDDTQSCGTDLGECTIGTQVCTGGQWGACSGEEPFPETCDGLDNDCDGEVDEICPCVDGAELDCGSGVGACSAGKQVCQNGEWGACSGDLPGIETCDGVDNDCDGATDESLVPPACAMQDGVCAGSAQACGGASGWADCDYGSDYEADETLCDALDNDCDGDTDEDVCFSWWRGNTHTHSTLSADGNTSPADLAEGYKTKGYNFLVLTDHGVASDFAQYSDPDNDFLCIDGVEFGTSTHHINGLGITDTITVSAAIQDNVDAIRGLGGVPTLNHPLWASLVVDFWNIYKVNSQLAVMEIYNYVTNGNVTSDERMWDDLLSSGKRIFGAASDDCHSLGTGSGHGWIMVRAIDLTRDSILQAIEAGDFYSSSGVTLNDVVIESDQMIVDSQDGELIEFIGRDGHVLETVTGALGVYQFKGPEKYVRARVSTGDQFAWTQPAFLDGFDIDPWADAVLDWDGVTLGTHQNVLGPVYEGKIPSNFDAYTTRIANPGYIDLDMGEGEEVINVSGPDLYVEEANPEDNAGFSSEPYKVYAKDDLAAEWQFIGSGTGDAYFDLSDASMDQARYIRILVDEGSDTEIDAVEANFPDPYADRVVSSSGILAGDLRYILGSPTAGPIRTPWENYAVRIDVGGHVVLDLGPGEEAQDGPGDDIYVEEVDNEDLVGGAEPYNLSGSNDLTSWTLIGQGTGDTYFDLDGTGMASVRYLMIEPTSTDAEFDGVRVLNPLY